MSFDRSQSTYSSTRSWPVLAGQTIAAEGTPLIAVDNGSGGVAVKACAGAGGEKFVGFARTDNIRGTTRVVQESVTVPTGGGVVNLANGQIVNPSVYAYDETDATARTVVYVGAPAAGEVSINVTNGTATFNVAEQGNTVTITYRYNLTVEEVKMINRESLPNNIATDYLGVVGAMGGEGQMFVDTYDTSVAYAALGTIYLESGGVLSSAAGGTAIGYCTKVPSVSNPMLGVKFTVTI